MMNDELTYSHIDALRECVTSGHSSTAISYIVFAINCVHLNAVKIVDWKYAVCYVSLCMFLLI